MADHTEQTITMSDGAQVVVARAVSGQSRVPFVLVHGWGMSEVFWDEHVGRFARTRDVVVPSLRMHGASLALAPLAGVPVSIARIVDDLREIMDVEGIVAAVLVGHSMGGLVVAEFARRHPDRTAAVVAADPAYGATAEEILVAPTRRPAQIAVALTRFEQSRPALARTHAGAYGVALERLYDSEYLDDDAAGARPRTAELLHTRRRPALVIYSTVEPAEWEYRQTAGRRDLTDVRVWPGVDHLFPAAHPIAFTWTVDSWLEQRAI